MRNNIVKMLKGLDLKSKSFLNLSNHWENYNCKGTYILLTILMMVNVIFLFLIWWKVYEYVNINMENEILLSSKIGIEYICMDMVAAAVYVIGIV